MSERDPEQELAAFERRAEAAGIHLRPETRELIRRKLQQSAEFERQQKLVHGQHDATPLCGDAPLQPPAVGETSAAERAESGGEKKDRELFALRRVEAEVDRSGDMHERRRHAEERIRNL